jgi:hypothetical protein
MHQLHGNFFLMDEIKSYKVTFDLSRQFKYIKKIFKRLEGYFFING